MIPDPEEPGNYVSVRWIPPGVQRYYFSRGENKIIN